MCAMLCMCVVVCVLERNKIMCQVKNNKLKRLLVIVVDLPKKKKSHFVSHTVILHL